MNDIVNGIYQSWFSKDYPKDWKISRLKELISGIRKEKNKSEDTPVISLTINGVKIKNNLSEGMNPKTYIGHQLVYPGDLVICLRDLDGPLLVGISEHYGCTSNLYVVLQFDEQNLDYYNYIFKTMDYLRVIDDFSYGMRHSYNISQFCQLRLPAPQLLIQNKIVQKLIPVEQKIDQLINNQQQQIEKLKEYKQSLISEVVTKGLDPNVEFKDSGIEWIGKIPKYWNLSRIKDLLSIPLFYGSNKAGDLFNEDYPRYIRITDIQEDSLTTDISNMQSYLHSDYKKYLLQENDVLFARSGATSGKTYLVKHEDINNVFAGYLINGRFDQDKINPYFFNYYTKSSIWDMWKNYIFIQATIQNISAEKFNSFILSVPTLEDQNRIVDFLNTKMNKLDELIRLKKNKVAKLENFKKSLIYEYVTGKKEVS